MTNEQKDQIITLLRKAQTKYAKQTRDLERGYYKKQPRDYERGCSKGAIVGIEKACEALGYIVKYNPIDDDWSIEEKK